MKDEEDFQKALESAMDKINERVMNYTPPWVLSKYKDSDKHRRYHAEENENGEFEFEEIPLATIVDWRSGDDFVEPGDIAIIKQDKDYKVTLNGISGGNWFGVMYGSKINKSDVIQVIRINTDLLSDSAH